jgi:putative ABC transport system ATP-binding protein
MFGGRSGGLAGSPGVLAGRGAQESGQPGARGGAGMSSGDRSLYAVRDVRFSYQLGALRVPALNGVVLDIDRGDFVCLSGPSGSGKTTLLNLLGLIEPVQEGSIAFAGRSLQSLSERERNRIRRYRIGFVFQTFQLFPVLRADENVEYFLTRQRLPRATRRERVRSALEVVGLWEHRHKRPSEMSGGQRQRVAVARAKQPDVIIADEPTAHLDQTTGRGVMDVLSRLNLERAVTLIMASHDPMAQSFARRQIRLVDGRIC